MKWERLSCNWEFKYFYDSVFDKDNDIYKWNLFSYYKWIITIKLFYSLEETKVIADKLYYDYLSQSDKSKIPAFYNDICIIDKKTNWRTEYNLGFKTLNNYFWRLIVCWWFSFYTNQYKKEQDLRDLRQSILDKLK